MIIILESEEDRIALAKTYDWIEDQAKKQEEGYTVTSPIYYALIVNNKKETPAQ